jgi:hypothetical protein
MPTLAVRHDHPGSHPDLCPVRLDLVTRDAPVAQPDNSPSEAGDLLFVSDQHNRASGIVQRTEQLHDLKAGGGIEVARGLIGKQDRGIVDQRPGDRDPLLLATGELTGMCFWRSPSPTCSNASRAGLRRSRTPA